MKRFLLIIAITAFLACLLAAPAFAASTITVWPAG